MIRNFFLAMVPPTVTHQEKKIRVVNGKPIVYEPEELKAARMKLRDYLAPYRPERPLTCGIRLLVKWCFPITGDHYDGEYRTTKPDTDNLQKLFKDVSRGRKLRHYGRGYAAHPGGNGTVRGQCRPLRRQ